MPRYKYESALDWLDAQAPLVEIQYKTRDLGNGSDEDAVTGRWKGEADTWGKREFAPEDRSDSLWLFADEILSETEVTA